MPEADTGDDLRYAQQAMAHSSEPGVARMGKAVALFAAGLAMLPRCEWRSVFPNDVAATACLARTLRQLRAACTLMMWGYCAESRVVLRSAYESAATGRMLAKDPARAEKWLRTQHWFPDREVRKWFADSGPNSAGATPDEILSTYGIAYRQMSRKAHPTAIACLSALDLNDHGPAPQLETVFVEEDFLSCSTEIAIAAIFACFALRNAAVDERALHPQWRKDVYELAREITSSDMPHLDRDWAEEEQQYEQLEQKVQSAARLTETLRADPRSWFNLRASDPPQNGD